MKNITLNQALAENRLADFIKQVEAEGMDPAPAGAFDALLGRVIKEPLRVDQTSRSPGRGGSPGK